MLQKKYRFILIFPNYFFLTFFLKKKEWHRTVRLYPPAGSDITQSKILLSLTPSALRVLALSHQLQIPLIIKIIVIFYLLFF